MSFLKSINSVKWQKLLLGIILMVSLGLRIPAITWGIPINEYTSYYHADEGKIALGINNFPQDFVEREDLRYPTGTHYFTGFILLPLKIWNSLPSAPQIQLNLIVYLFGRFITILQGVGAVYLTFVYGSRLFNSTIGLFAASFLGVSLYPVINSSLLTADVPLSFWFLVILLITTNLKKNPNLKNFLFLGITTGLVIGLKYTGAFIIVPIGIIIFYIFIDQKDKHKRWSIIKLSILSGAVSVLVFILTTPTIALNFDALTDSLQYEIALTDTRKEPIWYPDSWNRIYHNFETAASQPIAIISIIGLLFILFQKPNRTTFPLILFVLSPIAYFSSYFIRRYFIWILPITSIFAAILLEKTLSQKNKFIKTSVYILITFTLGYSTLTTIVGINVRLNDTRTLSSKFINDTISPGSTIGNTKIGNFKRYGLPSLNPEKYNIVDSLESPDYIILTSFQYPKIQTALDSNFISSEYTLDNDSPFTWYPYYIVPSPKVFELYDNILNHLGVSYNYELIKTFSNEQAIDISYTSPEIRIYKKNLLNNP